VILQNIKIFKDLLQAIKTQQRQARLQA